MVTRLLKHLFIPDALAHRAFPPSTLRAVEKAVKDSERLHRGEIRFVAEASLSLPHLRMPLRKRAEALFGELGVWDTEENSGVLLYVQLVDRRIEIVADRGIAARVPQADWDAVCRAMEGHFRAGRFAEGADAGIEGVGRLLAQHFPGQGGDRDEQPNAPVIL